MESHAPFTIESIDPSRFAPRVVERTRKSRLASSSSVDARLMKVIRAVQAHPSNRISIHVAAPMAGLETRYFCTLFRRQVGLPFAAWCRHQRVQWACTFMSDQRLSLAAIAMKVGYRDLSSLERAFRAVMGMTPRKYRQLKHHRAVSI